MVDQTDAASADAATATVTVSSVADAPTASALEVSTDEDTALTFKATDFEGVFSDPDAGDSLKKVQVITLPDAEHGALTVVLTVGQDATAVTENQEIKPATWESWCSRRWRTGTGMRRSPSRWWTRVGHGVGWTRRRPR